MEALSAQSVGKKDNKAHRDLKSEYFKQMISLKKLCYFEDMPVYMPIISINIDILAPSEPILFLIMAYLRKATFEQPRLIFFSKKINIGDQILKERGQLKSLEARAILNFYWLNTIEPDQRKLLFFGYIREFEKNHQECEMPNELKKRIYFFTFLKSTAIELNIDDVFETKPAVLIPLKIH